MINKTCTNCNEPKPATTEFFHAYPRNTDGLRGECKVCHKARKRAWEAAHPEKVRASKRRRYAANPETDLERAKKWQQENPERYRANMENWYAGNGDALKESMRLDRIAHPEKYREYDLKKKFGITLEDFETRLNEQDRKCASCETTEPKGPNNYVFDLGE
jgi:hypothetical protein